MKFKGVVQRWSGRAAAGLVVGVLTACGGGTQIDEFSPSRVLAFGDEASVTDDAVSGLTATGNGARYFVNGVKYVDPNAVPLVPVTPLTVDCNAGQTWVEYLASNYGMSFPQCPRGLNSGGSRILAKAGAKAADVAQQVTDFMASGSFTNTDLVTVMAGLNDIVANFEAYKSHQIDKATALAAVNAAGTAVGSQVVRITDAGAKVLIATLPDVGVALYGAASGEQSVVTELTREFNKALGLRLEDVRNGGRSAGLVQAYDIVQSMYQTPSGYGLRGVTSGSTTVSDATPWCLDANPAPTCTTQSLRTLDTSVALQGTPLWADDRHFGQYAHNQIGANAITRARNNPF